MDTLYGNWGKDNHIWNQINKNKEPNVWIVVLDEN
jgi:hypothetical protein